MPRNASGNYSLPAGNPVVSDTLIEADNWANPTMNDLGAELTDSLSRSGKGGMTAEFSIIDGTELAPGLRFSAETGSGMFRSAPGVWGFTVLGVEVLQLTASGISFAGSDGALLSPILITDGTGAGVDPVVGGDNFAVTAAGACGMSLLGLDADLIAINLGTTSDSTGAKIEWDHDHSIVVTSDGLLTVGTRFSTAGFSLRAGDNVEGIFINPDGAVGMGVQSTEGRLHVHSSSSGAANAVVGARDLIVESGNAGGMTVLTTGIVKGSYVIGSSGAAEKGCAWDWLHSTREMNFGTHFALGYINIRTGNNVLAMHITDDQWVGIRKQDPESVLHLSYDTFGAVLTVETNGATDDSGPNADFFRDSGTSANLDALTAFNLFGNSSTGVKRLYASIGAHIVNVTNAAEEGRLAFSTIVAGAEAEQLVIGDGVYTPGVADSGKGAGTINATEYYKEGILMAFCPGVPTGMVAAFALGTVQTSWLPCDGAAVSRTTFSALFAFLGTAYGVGDGSTTFNVPDYRGEFLRGTSATTGRDPDAASRTNRGDGTTGDTVGTKQGHQFLSHTHTVDSFVQVGVSTSGAQINVTTSTKETSATGGNETRGRNVNVNWFIKT